MKMKLMMAFFMISVSSLVASEVYSQATRLTLQLSDAHVREVLEKIEENSEFFFLYNSKLIDVDRKVSVDFNNEKINEILEEVFSKTGVEYVVLDRQIVLSNKKFGSVILEAASQQTRKITGKITDRTGAYLPGVSIVIKGTTSGTVSDVQGEYSISNVPENAVLQFSFVGMKTQEIEVGNQIIINVTLIESLTGLDEVVVIGYGTQSREMITTSITKMDSKVLEYVPYSNAASALQGTVSGVRVQSTSGQPGATPRIIVRGGTSINNPNGATPLYIIDGILRPDMNDISSDDIESVQVLKDAAATAIYGARGSNGVVIVTTKSGKSGKTKITYGYNLELSNVGKTYDFANAKDYLTIQRLGLVSNPTWPNYDSRLTLATGYGTGNNFTKNTAFTTMYLTDENKYKLDEGWQSMPDPIDPSKTLIFQETDFQDLTYQTGISNNHHLEVSGGTDKATFNAGLGYLSNQGTLITTKYDRLSFNLSSTIKATDNLEFEGRLIFSSSSTNASPFGTNATFYRSPALAPTAKVYFEDGTLTPGQDYNLGNPLYNMQLWTINNTKDNLSLSFGATWNILPGLTFKPQVSMYSIYDNTYRFRKSYQNGAGSVNVTRYAYGDENKWKQYQADAVFNYIKTFTEDHNLDVTAGYSYFSRQIYLLSAQGEAASSDLIPTLNASGKATAVSGSISDQILMGYFGRVNYNYKTKYLLSLTARYDGSSVLGQNNKWGFFPGVSAGWLVNKEEFWNSIPQAISKLKLRTSYGVNGNIGGLTDYASQGNYSVGSQYSGQAAIMMSAMANEDLKWEQSKTLDFGADLGLFKNRINILFDVYKRVTDNLITNFVLPPSTGFTSILTNLGSLENKGVEFEISTNVLPETSKLQWNISFNASKVKNKILSLPYNGTENNRIGGFYIWDADLGDYAWKGGLQEGETIGDMFAYKQIGVYATDADAQAPGEPVDMIVSGTVKTKYGGDVKWFDADGNGKIEATDRVYVGNEFPDWTGGFSNSLSYKGFDLYLRFDYSIGQTIFNVAKTFNDYNWAGNTNVTQDLVDNVWMQQGDIAKYPRSSWGGERVSSNMLRGNSISYESGDFLCVREVTLSYNLTSEILKKIKVNNIRFNVTGSNLYYFTKYLGLNPEFGGRDDGRYALPRSVIFGANITF
jgi:TonB-linked SusC/RagA family outer membrane protein